MQGAGHYRNRYLGPDRRRLTIRCLPLDPWARFQKLFGTFLVSFYGVFAQYEWPEWDDYKADKQLARFQLVITSVASYGPMRRRMLRIVKQTLFRDPINAWVPWWRPFARMKYRRRWGKFRAPSWRYFRRHVTAVELMKIFVAEYLFNIAAVKKNAAFLAEKVGVDMDACLSSSLRRWAGPIGKLLRPLFPRSPFIHRDGSNPTSLRILGPEELANLERAKRDRGARDGEGGDSGASQ